MNWWHLQLKLYAYKTLAYVQYDGNLWWCVCVRKRVRARIHVCVCMYMYFLLCEVGPDGDRKHCLLSPSYWLGPKEVMTCYDVYHFFVNCYAVLWIGVEQQSIKVHEYYIEPGEPGRYQKTAHPLRWYHFVLSYYYFHDESCQSQEWVHKNKLHSLMFNPLSLSLYPYHPSMPPPACNAG